MLFIDRYERAGLDPLIKNEVLMLQQVWLPPNFRPTHRKITLDYLYRSHSFRGNDWREILIAIDILKQALILLPSGWVPFPLIYRQEVEARYADWFISELYQAHNIQRESKVKWSTVAKRITTELTQAGLYRTEVPASQLLLAYCLYWWRSFTLGYTLEIEIQRDLESSGLEFQANDLRQRQARLAPYDLMINGFYGDIKTSTYFLNASRTRTLNHDFYITRIYGKYRVRTMVVFIQDDMWKKIDGDTVIAILTQIADVLPQAAQITHEGAKLMIIEYELWKEKMRQYQRAP